MGQKLLEVRTPLTEAAAALEVELARFEQLAKETHAIPLDSEANFGRAAQAMQRAADCQERTANLVRALVEAMNRARDTQQVTAEKLLDRAEQLKQRTDLLEAMLDRFRTLGSDAREIQALVGAVHERGAARDLPGALGALDRARALVDELAKRAEALTRDAATHGIRDVEREAGALHTQLAAAGEKLGLLSQSLANSS